MHVGWVLGVNLRSIASVGVSFWHECILKMVQVNDGLHKEIKVY